MADLLGLKLDYAKHLPPESKSKEGFENNGMVLGMSPIQMEYYLQSAREGLAQAIVEGERPKFYSKTVKKDKGGGPGKEWREQWKEQREAGKVQVWQVWVWDHQEGHFR